MKLIKSTYLKNLFYLSGEVNTMSFRKLWTALIMNLSNPENKASFALSYQQSSRLEESSKWSWGDHV